MLKIKTSQQDLLYKALKMIDHKNAPCQYDYRKNFNPPYKHGDKVSLIINNIAYDGHVEKRMLNQWPDERFDLFVIIENTTIPHFPISIKNFKENYGTIYLKNK